jgi:hypothetical protein
VPRRGVCSPPGPELLGVITSRGPSRESYRSSRKSRGWPAEAIGPPTAEATVPAERVRTAFSSPASAPALLQREVPGGGAEVVAVEGPGEIPCYHGGQTETERSEPALPGADQKPETTGARGSYRSREGNHSGFFSIIAATGRGAMRDSYASSEVPCNASARTSAGAPWSASRTGSGAGNRRAT